MAVFLVLWTVVSLLTLFLSERSPRPHYTGMAATAAAIIVGGGIVFAMICLMMAWLSTKGWAWAFWVDLVLLGLGGIGAFADLRDVANSPAALPGELLNVAALALFIWFVIALVKYGVWARVTVRGPGARKRSTDQNPR